MPAVTGPGPGTAKQGLEAIDGVKLVTPMAERLSAGIVCFDVDRLDPGEVVERHVRFGTGLWVDEVDVDAALAAITRL